jgi:hypothetical protein
VPTMGNLSSPLPQTKAAEVAAASEHGGLAISEER